MKPKATAQPNTIVHTAQNYAPFPMPQWVEIGRSAGLPLWLSA